MHIEEQLESELSTQITLNELPEEILAHIFSFQQTKALNEGAKVCKDWHRIIEGDIRKKVQKLPYTTHYPFAKDEQPIILERMLKLIALIKDEQLISTKIEVKDLLLLFQTPELLEQLNPHYKVLLGAQHPQTLKYILNNEALKKIFFLRLNTVSEVSVPVASYINASLYDVPTLKFKGQLEQKEAYVLFLYSLHNVQLGNCILEHKELKEKIAKVPAYLVDLSKKHPALAYTIIKDPDLRTLLPKSQQKETKTSIMSSISGVVAGAIIGLCTAPFICTTRALIDVWNTPSNRQLKHPIDESNYAGLVIPFIALFYGFSRGVHRGFKGGFLEALKLPQVLWQEKLIEEPFAGIEKWSLQPSTADIAKQFENNQASKIIKEAKEIEIKKIDSEQLQIIINNPVKSNSNYLGALKAKLFNFFCESTKNSELNKENEIEQRLGLFR